MATHQARAIQISPPTGCCSNKARIVLTIEVTGWFSAKARTGPGIEAVGTNAELTNGSKMIGYEKAPAPSVDFADSPAITAIQVSASWRTHVAQPGDQAMGSMTAGSDREAGRLRPDQDGCDRPLPV
jgi:hypothetical protein